MYSVDVNHQRKHTKVKIVDNVCVVTFNSPKAKVNSLNREVMTEVEELMSGIERDPGISSAVLISGNFFISLKQIIICLLISFFYI